MSFWGQNFGSFLGASQFVSSVPHLCFCALFFAKLLEFLLVSAVHRGEQGLRSFLYRDPCASLTALESLFHFPPLLIQMLLVLIFTIQPKSLRPQDELLCP